MKITKTRFANVYKQFEILLIAIHVIAILGLILFVSGISWDVINYIGVEFFLLPLRIRLGSSPEIFGSLVYYTLLLLIPLVGLYFFRKERKKVHFLLLIVAAVSAVCHYLVVQAIAYIG